MRIEIESHAADIPRRLKEIDPALWVVFNTAKGKYEVWGLDAAARPYVLSSWDDLDARVEYAIREAYWIARNTGDPYGVALREIAEREYRREKADEKEADERIYGFNDHVKYMDTPVITPGMEL